MSILTINNIDTLSYTDFVWALNQWNSLPWGYSTINKWIIFGHISHESTYLDVACTTWLKSRTISQLTWCKSIWIDISQQSINSAIYNKEHYSAWLDLNYFCIDGTSFMPEKKFSHVSFWASLRFFNEPDKMIEHTVNNLLVDNGFILANEFYVSQELPKELVDDFYKEFNIYPTTLSYKNVMNTYRWLEVYYEDQNRLIPETDYELDHYCKSTVQKYFSETWTDYNEELFVKIYSRLLRIKKLSNNLRPFQSYNTLVLKYNSKVYPNRYVELF